MNTILDLAKKPFRFAKRVARKGLKTIRGTPPPSPSRLTGKLAQDGGLPVRNLNQRPWPKSPDRSAAAWAQIAPRLEAVFRSGVEGLPLPLGKQLADKWAAYCTARFGLLLPHGTDALRVGLAAALDHDGLDYGGEIIAPNLSFIASATCALDRRIGVALVDVSPDTLTMDPREVEKAIIPGKTRALMAVHLFGQPADMTALQDIAKRYQLKLIEDAAQAQGAIHELGRAGVLGDVAGFSFQSSKNLTCGEGGALTTNDEALFDRAHQIYNAGRARVGGERWGHVALGWNIRPTEYSAALLLARLENFEAEQQRRHERLMSLTRHLRAAGVTCVQPVSVAPWVKRHGAHLAVVRYKADQCDGLDIKDFVKTAQKEGLPIARGYEWTLMQQPALRHIAETRSEYLRATPTPHADAAVKELLFIPHAVLLGTDADMQEIAAGLHKIQAHYAPQHLTQGRSSPGGTPSGAATITITHEVRRLRLGLLGAGVMGRIHAEAIAKNPRLALTAMADAQPDLARDVAGKFSCKAFASVAELLASDAVDGVVIAIPHWQHGDAVVAGLNAGLHVICEKPLTVTVAQADEVLRVAAQSKSLFAAVHQTRFQPAYLKAKEILASGELGPVYRCHLVESAWRTQAYYQSSPWRGTWKGEGGGVLLNQAPHVLDRYAWLWEMPASITARCDTNLHQIEVEDTVSAILHHTNGAHGFIHMSTIEAPPINRTEIACDRGRLLIEEGRLSVIKLRHSIRERTANDTRLLGELERETREYVTLKLDTPALLQEFYNNFADAVAGTASLVCPGAEGRHAVELANAMILSSMRSKPISLPMDRDEYTRLIKEKIGS